MGKIIVIVGTILFSLAIIAGIIFVGIKNNTKPQSNSVENTRQTTNTTTPAELQQSAETKPAGITMTDVTAHTGKDGQACWVAVNGEVYEINGFAVWVDGIHTPSGGRARCGKDLTEVIKQSPHGTRVLKLLKDLGPLTSQ